MIEAILPLSNREPVRRHVDRAALLLQSLGRFWSDTRKLTIHVIAPDTEVAFMSDALRGLATDISLDVRFCAESRLSPEIAATSPELGYAKQMLIKLAAFEIVSSPSVLIFDSDVVCCRAFGHGSFVRDGRVISDWAVPTLHEWWHESARVAGVPLPPDALKRPRLGITPQLLSCAALREVTSYLSALFGRGWIGGLLARYTGRHPHIWTEYALYDLILERLGRTWSYHVPPEDISPLESVCCKEQNIWTAGDFGRWNPAQVLRDPTLGHFMVLQSITAADLDFDVVRRKWLHALASPESESSVDLITGCGVEKNFHIPQWVSDHPDEHLPRISAKLQVYNLSLQSVPDDIDYLFILFSNRSGSTLLCELLASTDFLPLAQEALHVDTVLETAQRISSARFDEVFAALVRAGTRNGKFVAKASLGQVCMLATCGILGRILPRTKFILIERMDKVAQIVSWSIATQTGQFTSYHDMSASCTLVYREENLRMDIQAQMAQEAAVREFMAFNGIVPLHVTYETLVAHPHVVGNLITAWACGGERPVRPENVQIREQKTSTNRAWANRFLASISRAAN